MYKNQLQELAQRSCFNLPSYACIREGPDHAPRFRASVNFNGEIFEGPSYCHTLRQAEHAAAEVALNTLSTRGPSRSLAARVLDETGVFKNLLQETAHRAGLNLPVYTTVRSGPGHLPVFTCTVELAGMNFIGEPAKTKKQAEKNAAMAAWSSLKQLPNLGSLSQSNKETESNEEQEQVVVAKVLSNFKPKDENKPIRRRKMMLGYRDNSSISSPNNTSQYQKYQPLDPLLDVSSIYPTQQHQQQNSCFLALPTPSRILQQMPTFQQSITAASQDQSPSKDSIGSNNNKNPPLFSSNRPIPVHIRSKSQIRIQEIRPPLEEHQKDEEEWLGGRSDVKGKQTEIGSSSANFGPSSTSISPFLLPQTPNFKPASAENRTQQPQIRTRPFRLSTPMPAPIRTSPGIPRPRFLHSSEFHLHSIAPAVHIRSVIPVCAAPPTKPPSNPPTAQKKETSISASAPAPPTTEEVSLASSMLDKLQL